MTDLGYVMPEEAGLSQRYGVWVGGLGDDPIGSAGWIACTHDRPRALAAIDAEVREVWGSPVLDYIGIREEWWRLVTNCGCGDTCPHEADTDGFVECDDCDLYGLPPCVMDELTWIGDKCGADVPGAVPVTVVREVVT